MKKITRKEAEKLLSDAERNEDKIVSDEQHEILLQHPLYKEIVNRKAK